MVNGNIMGVVHNREQIINNRICINITFEVDDNSQVEGLKNIWKSRDIVISRIGSVYETFTMDYLLIGDLDASYIEGIIDEASKTISLEAVDVRYSSKTVDPSKRTGMISVKARSEEDLDRLDGLLNDVCRKSGIVYVRGV
ncbi:MAG: homoserine dehydrogenase [Candidatus Methanomethylophilaceae archaeon]|nr:homoserine dehydrogenase [Candidatus Methanomethylophilaceae archaeon]